MSYKNYNWEVCANDYNSPYLRNWLWTHSFFKYPKLLGIYRAVLGIASRNNQIEYLADFSTWTKAHEELKAQVTKNPKVFEKLINKSVVWGEKLNKWTERNIFKKDLAKLSGKELLGLLNRFVDMQEDEYAYGTALPILDFIGFSFVEGNLVKFLKEKVQGTDYQKYYSVFTEPENNSFAQDQEEDLLRLMVSFWKDKALRADLKEKPLNFIEANYPRFYSKLSEHTRKYGWVYYVYMGPAFTPSEFLNFIKDYLNKGVEPKGKLAEIQKKKKEVKKLKQAYIKELKPDKFNAFILNIAGRVVWAKPRRKDYQSRSYYHVEKLLEEISHRLSISLEQTRSAPYEILGRALAGEKFDWELADEIKEFHICLPNDDGTVATLVGKEAEEFSKTQIKRIQKGEQELSVKEIKGTTACIGQARGVVKIINVPNDMDKMEYGNILVSTATTPSVVPAMKKAAAIVTDEGGLTCHAAIVSRELKIPCVVGTKIATKVLKDGMMVEVDANQGIVKIIK